MNTCVQALLALLTAVQREARDFGHLFACFIDIRKAFRRFSRYILPLNMSRLGNPRVHIKCLCALCTDNQESVRSSEYYCAPFRLLKE